MITALLIDVPETRNRAVTVVLMGMLACTVVSTVLAGMCMMTVALQHGDPGVRVVGASLWGAYNVGVAMVGKRLFRLLRTVRGQCW